MAYEDEKKGELETLLNDILEDKNTNLTPENLKKGVTVLGVDGNYIGTDTSDATATNEDVLEGKTAYAQGQKLTGTLRVEDVDSVLDMFPSIETGISEEIDINDAVENNFNDLSIYGSSRQESREGYNVFNYLPNVKTSVNNLTVDKNEDTGYITINGTPNTNYSQILEGININDLLEDGETYTILQENANNLDINYVYSQIIKDNKESLVKDYLGTRTTFNQTFTVDKTTYNYYANIQTGTIEDTGTLNNFKTRFMIYKGTEEKAFELFGISPSPDYPQEIESIKDSITFKRTGKNIISINEKVGSGQKQLIINTDGASKAQQPFKLKSGDKVTVSYKMSNTQILNNSFLCTRKGDISYNYPFNGTTGTITIENDIDYIGLVVYLTEVVDSNFKIYDIQIEKGSEATEYEPYNENVYTINLNTDLSSINILSKQLEYNYVDEDGNKYLCDVIDFKNKKIIKYLNKIILPKENITWTQNKDETDFFEIANYTILNDYQAKGDLAISNYFRDYRYKSNYLVANLGTIYIRFPKSSGIDTLQKAQEFMDTHDVEVLYVLANPKEIALTDEELSYLEQFPLQKGINHIFSDDELSPKFQLKYYRDINIMLESEIINNAESKFNIFYDSKVEEFNTNADEKLKGYNTNATSKINEYNTNADEKLKGYNTNATNKINEYNTNADEKLEEYNSSANEKLEEFNTNATEKTTAYNTNAEDKLNEYNTNATNKINEYNSNAESILKILPKTETEIQENIDVDDAAESNFNKLRIFGNNKQESTEGRNLLYEIRSGYLTTVENQEATTTEGSQFGNWQINFKNRDGSTSISLEAGEYYVSLDLKINSGSVSNPLNLIALADKDGQETINNPVPTTEYQRYCFKSIFNSAKNVNNIIIQKHYDEEICSFKIKNVMISKMSDYIYEPYTGGNPSPNPDYPQEIESLGNIDTFLLEKDAKLKQYINAKINQSFALGESERTKVFQNVLKVKSGKKYTIAWTKNTVLDNVVRQCVITNDSNIVVQEFMITPDTEQCLFTANVDGMLSIGLDLNSTAVKISKEYRELTFKRIGKNIFNKNNDFLDNFYIDPSNKKIVYSIYGNSVIVKCKANTNYTVSRKSILVKDFVVGSVAEYPVDGTPAINIVYGRDKLNITINSGENAKYLIAYIMWSNEGKLQDVLDSIQIEEGSVLTEYEPYHEDVYTLPVQQNMYALVEGQEDCFVKKDDGKWYERHYSFEGILDEETYNIDPAGVAIYNLNKFGFPKSVYTIKTKQYLNYFKFNINWSSIKGTAHYSGNSLWINYFDNRESVNQFIKAKKEEGNPLKIVYIRGETNGSILYPLDLECTPEQVEVLNKLEQFSLDKGINHIFSDDELSPKFQLKYYQDMNILLDKINKNIADVSAQLL